MARPAWSYRLNADFEDHAEHEYALLVQEHPEWEDEPYDERLHRVESEVNMRRPRFA